MSIRRQVTLPQGTLEYQDIGAGRPLLFIHGLLVNGDLWNKVIAPLSKTYRCIVPDLPLGGHRLPMKSDTDLTAVGFAQIIADFIQALDLHDVVLLGNDTGGALCQVTCTHFPQLFSALILTNCDAFEDFPPPSLRIFQYAARLPGSMWVGGQCLRVPFIQRLAVRLLQHTPVTPTQADSYFHGLARIGGVQHDARKAFLGVNQRFTLEAASLFHTIDKPVLLVWGRDDQFFTVALAERLHKEFQDVTLHWVEGSKTFVMQDQPDVFLKHVSGFIEQRFGQYAATP